MAIRFARNIFGTSKWGNSTTETANPITISPIETEVGPGLNNTITISPIEKNPIVLPPEQSTDPSPAWLQPIINIVSPEPTKSNPLPADNISSWKPQEFISANSGKTSGGFLGIFGMPDKNKPAPSSPQGIPTQFLLIVSGIIAVVLIVLLLRR